MLEKIIMADLPEEYALTAAQLQYYSRKARLLHRIELCERRLQSNPGANRTRFELMLFSYLSQLGLMEQPC